MIPTTRHLQYARGYLDLGMVNEASDELEAIDWDKLGLWAERNAVAPWDWRKGIRKV